MMKSNSLKQEKGFSLLEVMVSMAIGTVVLMVVSNTFLLQQKTYKVQEQITEMVQMARATMDIMTREIRMAGYDPSGAGFTGVTLNNSQIQIFADIDGNNNTSGPEEAITYSYNSSQKAIYRNRNNILYGTMLLSDQVEDFDFRYLRADGNTATTAAEIRQIQITLTFRTARPDSDYPDNGGYRTYDLTSTITPKNLAL